MAPMKPSDKPVEKTQEYIETEKGGMALASAGLYRFI
jgi:hypothetical protein